MPDLLAFFISVANPTGAEPVPDAALMNDTQNLQVKVEPGKTYMLRMVNMAAFAAQYFWFEGHTMQIVEVDGIYTEPAEAGMIYITPAQRYSFLLTTKNDSSSNFAIVGSMDQVSGNYTVFSNHDAKTARISSMLFLMGSIPMLQDGLSMMKAKSCPSPR